MTFPRLHNVTSRPDTKPTNFRARGIPITLKWSFCYLETDPEGSEVRPLSHFRKSWNASFHKGFLRHTKIFGIILGKVVLHNSENNFRIKLERTGKMKGGVYRQFPRLFSVYALTKSDFKNSCSSLQSPRHRSLNSMLILLPILSEDNWRYFRWRHT